MLGLLAGTHLVVGEDEARQVWQRRAEILGNLGDVVVAEEDGGQALVAGEVLELLDLVVREVHSVELILRHLCWVIARDGGIVSAAPARPRTKAESAISKPAKPARVITVITIRSSSSSSGGHRLSRLLLCRLPSASPVSAVTSTPFHPFPLPSYVSPPIPSRLYVLLSTPHPQVFDHRDLVPPEVQFSLIARVDARARVLARAIAKGHTEAKRRVPAAQSVNNVHRTGGDFDT